MIFLGGSVGGGGGIQRPLVRCGARAFVVILICIQLLHVSFLLLLSAPQFSFLDSNW